MVIVIIDSSQNTKQKSFPPGWRSWFDSLGWSYSKCSPYFGANLSHAVHGQINLHNTSRIWQLLCISTPTTLVQGTIFFHQNHCYSLLLGLLLQTLPFHPAGTEILICHPGLRLRDHIVAQISTTTTSSIFSSSRYRKVNNSIIITPKSYSPSSWSSDWK